MRLLWATCGRTWGFRFLLDGGDPDPLPAYERAFGGAQDERALCRRVGDRVALRFPDPEGRRDQAGRVIPHEFVVLPPLADDVHTLGDGLRVVWPLVADAYDRLWLLPRPPSPDDVRSALDSSLRDR